MALEEKQAITILERIESETKARLDEMADAQDALATEVRERGGVTKETKDTIEKIEGDLAGLIEAYEEVKELAPQLREMKSQLERPGGVGQKGRTSPGIRFAESEQYKSWVEENANVKSKDMRLGMMDNLLGEQKMMTSDEGVWGGAGLLIEPLRLPGILQAPQRELRFRDLVNVMPVNTDAVVYVKESGFANLYTVLTANASSGQPVVTVANVNGFFAGQTVVVGGETKVINTGGVNSATNQLTFTTNLASGKTAGQEVTSDQLGGTPHGGKKPESSLSFEEDTATLITIAHWVAAHRQTLEDVPQLQSYINNRLLYGLEMALEDHCFYGTGTASTLMGIFNHPEVQNQGTRTGNDPNGNPWTEIDWIRKAMTKAMVAEYPVNGIIVNPLNWEAIELAKDADGRYLWVTVTDGGIRRIFGVPVVVSTVIRAGQFLTGAFGLGLTLLDRQRANIRVSDSHAEHFIQNVLAILAELRVGLAYIRPESLIKGQF
jgi:hypothetical protein